jgi:ribosomal protein S13
VKLEKAIDEAVQQAPPEIRAVIEALQALFGVAQTTAATIISELGLGRELLGFMWAIAVAIEQKQKMATTAG